MKTFSLLVLLIIAFAFESCNKKPTDNTSKANSITTNSSTLNIPKEPLPSVNLKANMDDEIPDTLVFNEKDAKYRLLENRPNFSFAIQRLDNTHWQTLDTFNRPQELSVSDWNKDGCSDIAMTQRWHIDMALFNPSKNSFDTPFDIGEKDGAFLLDDKKQLYYSMLTNKFEDEHSRLFSIENYHQILRGYIQGYVGDIVHKDKPQGVYVYKFKDNTLADSQLYDPTNLELIEQFTLEQYKKINTSKYLFYKQYWEKNANKF